MLCQREERAAGRPYPRTCPTCKLGPCQKDQPRTLIGENAIIAAKDAEIARLTAVLDKVSNDLMHADMRRITAEAELTALRAGQDALVAVAYEAAEAAIMKAWHFSGSITEFERTFDDNDAVIRAITHLKSMTPADATAALDAKLRAERNKVRRDIAEWVRPQRNHIPATGEEFANAILAMIEPEGK
ncbi:hypothetical protein GCM10007291_07540 [Gemmobacter nanjingensis]|uniref:Uncharacterized protein n=1 Tax=Gemmobacter nanjingensis TaxID=488454 RepID=A0ABQ3F7Y6_9RHOB|nr:hypothetical protein [Gemmobacter nanjingensis]GHC12728.1 hypothetical protein GCM10007291_07540 [Gemmobacter nanjingensis]